MKFYFQTQSMANWFYDNVMQPNYAGSISEYKGGWLIETRPSRLFDEPIEMFVWSNSP